MQSFTVKAPVRADLAGGTLDLWPVHCLVGTGRVINVTLSLMAETHFEVAPDNSFQLEVRCEKGEPHRFKEPLSLYQSKQLEPTLQFPVALISRYIEGKKTLPKMLIKVTVRTEAPRGSGLGGSSSLAVSIATGMARIFGDYADQGWQWKLMNWVKDVEAAFLRTPTGTQDYLGALFGGASKL